jgi:very-short-patch-repair endonuclease
VGAPQSQALCGGFKFRRQHRIGPYFADFCCVAQHLIIELDGSQHAEPEEERKERLRTAYLNRQGYRVLLEGVLAKLFIQR